MGILGMIGGLSGSILGGLPKGDTSGMASTVLWGLVLTTLAPVLGLGVGMILRHGARCGLDPARLAVRAGEHRPRPHSGEHGPLHALQRGPTTCSASPRQPTHPSHSLLP